MDETSNIGKRYSTAKCNFRGKRLLSNYWSRFWLRFSGYSVPGRMASRLACWNIPPHKGRVILAQRSPRGFIEPGATLYHDEIFLGNHCYIGDRVMIFQRKKGGAVHLGNHVCIYRDCILETGYGAKLIIHDSASIHPRCQINAYVDDIRIGKGVMLGPNCALYSYDHGIALDRPIREQPLQSKGPVVIQDEAWLGIGATVLSGVEIGTGAVIAAGSVVTSNVPQNAVAAGIPAKVVAMRE